MKYYLLIPLMLVLGLLQLNGQSRGTYETVSYYDGSFFIGHTIEEIGNDVRFLIQSTGDTITFNKNLTKNWVSSKDFFTYEDGRYHKKNGNFNILELAVGGNELDGTAQFEYIRGKLLSPRLGIGLGIGISNSTANSVTWSTLTFGEAFLYGKYYLNDNRRRLFVDAKVGAAIAVDSDNWLRYTSGSMVQPGIGFEFARSKKFRWSVKLTHLLQYTKIEPDQFRNDFFGRSVSIIDKRLINRTGLAFGLHF